MAEKNITPSYARAGMNKDVHFSALKPEEYTHAKNSNFSNETGNGWLIQNEHSNILASKFKEGFVVVGYKNDIFLDRTFYFLNNPSTEVSEIGVIKQNQSFDENNTITFEHQEYETILKDECEECSDCSKCLNFSPKFPIKTVEIHAEKSGTIMYWTDNLNPPRYLNLDKIDDYKFEGQILCGNDLTTPTCVSCDKLKMFKEPEVLEIEPIEIVLGGRLKRGTYQFLGAYCDILGNEQSRYFSLTNPVNIFEEQNNILQQSEIADETGYAIKLKVKNLDTNFTHYKIVAIQRNDINLSTTYIEEGIHSTSDNTIIYDTDSNKIGTGTNALGVSINTLVQPAIKIDKVQQLKEVNNTLFLNGITNKKEPNLQKVINLLGIYIQWQSYVAKEDLYKDGVSSAKYKGYFRDEVTPLAIRFIKDGGYTVNYPLIGRPLKTGEDDDIPLENKDLKSVNKFEGSSQISKYWQLYNTATNNGNICTTGDENITYNTLVENITKKTTVSDIGEVSNGEFILSINDGELFTDLIGFLNDNLEDLKNASPSEISEMSPDGSLQRLIELFDLDNPTNGTNNFPEYEAPETDTETGERISGCDEVDSFNFQNYIINQEIEIEDIKDENLKFNPFSFPDEYPRVRVETSNPCQLFEIDNTTGRVITLVGWSGKGRILKRTEAPRENLCNSAKEIFKTNTPGDAVFPIESFSYYFGRKPRESVNGEIVISEGTDEEVYSDVLTNKITSVLDAPNTPNSFEDNIIFTERVAKNASWYTYRPEDREDTFIMDLSRSGGRTTDNLGATPYRISVFSSCANNANNLVFHDFFTPREGNLIEFRKKSTGQFQISSKNKVKLLSESVSTYYISVESGILDFRDGVNFENDVNTLLDLYQENPPNPDFVSLGSQGCYNITILSERFKNVEITFDKITTRKIQNWSSPCSFQVPNLIGDTLAHPYQSGDFAYIQSLETYPDNKELYDSSDLKIKPEDFSNEVIKQPNGTLITFKDFFENTYTNGIQDENYVLKEDTDFRCKPIRHFKFPDNKKSPFMTSTRSAAFAQSLVFPLGITITEEIINNFLDIAKNNGLITEEEREEIKGYEILRGERDAEKSVVARGITFDLYKYIEKRRDIYYPNYPFNSLGDDIMHYDDDRKDFIKHPYNSQRNTNWTFHSPDTDYRSQNSSSSYMVVDGYLYGQSEANIDIVREHPKYTILGRRLKRLAGTLALAELIAETVAEIAQITSRGWFTVGVTGGGTSIPFTIAGAALVLIYKTLSGAIFKYARYKYEWLETFRNLGKRRDFANFLTAHGYYNYFRPNTIEGETIRYLNINQSLNEGRFSFTDSVEGNRLEINNRDREKTTLLSVGEEHPINYDNEYVSYDNEKTDSNLASRTFGSVDGRCQTGLSDSIRSNVASMYVTLKNFLPSQYGTIGSIKWVNTGYKGDLSNTKKECFGIFGGDCYISRHTFRRGFPFFNTTAMNQADMTPFEYKFYSNIGREPRFFLNFGIDSDERQGGFTIPFNNSEYELDCVDDGDDEGSYVKEPSKFYLEYNGIPNFLVESTVNTWNRYGKPEPWNNFYPTVGDKMEWTQPEVNPSRRGNKFFYNSNYSAPSPIIERNVLPVNYNKEEYNKRADAPNGTKYSLPDNSENAAVNPWLIFRPNNKFEFKTNYGKFTGMSELDSGKVLVTFENTSVIFNAVDQVVDDGQNPSSQSLGTGSIFNRRPQTMSDTELGYLGSQNFQILGTPVGHVFVDAKRGHVFLKRLGSEGGFEEISRGSGDKPSGMQAWFKEQLPFKILEYIPNYDIDNPYNGVGITIGFDSRYNRVFITKKDYIPKEGVTVDKDTEITLNNFKDVSWTVAYSLDVGKWISFYDFKPNFYVSHNDYFQTGVNIAENGLKKGLWTHLLTNKSYQTFYGEEFDWEVEVPIENKQVNKYLQSFAYRLDSRKYLTEIEYHQNKDIGFDEVFIHNDTNSTGNLKLNLQKTLRQLAQYPILDGDSQKILQSQQDGIFRFNYFYNRVPNESLIKSLLKYDENYIDREVNTDAVSFTGKKVLERMRGTYFLVNLKSKETEHKKLLELSLMSENLYDK